MRLLSDATAVEVARFGLKCVGLTGSEILGLAKVSGKGNSDSFPARNPRAHGISHRGVLLCFS